MNVHVELAKALGISFEKYQEIFKTQELLRNLDGPILKSVYRFRKCLERMVEEGSADRVRPKVDNLYSSHGMSQMKILQLIRPLLQDMLSEEEAARIKKAKAILEAVKDANAVTELPTAPTELEQPRKVHVHRAVTAESVVRSVENVEVYKRSEAPTLSQLQTSGASKEPQVISFINGKTGVGRSALVVQLAEVIAFDSGKRILLVDADLNADSSLSLIGDLRLERIEIEGASLTRLYRDKLEQENYFDVKSSIQKRVSNIHIPTLDLLASGIGLESVLDSLDRKGVAADGTLKAVINDVKGLYDYVFIDASNRKGFLLEESLLVSDYFCFVTRPDGMGTYFLPEWIEFISEFTKSHGVTLKSLGLILTQWDESSGVQRKVKQDLGVRFQRMFSSVGIQAGSVFKAQYPLVDTLKTAMLFHRQEPKTVKEKYGIGNTGGKSVYPVLLEIAQELIQKAK